MPIDRLMAEMRYAPQLWGPAPTRMTVLRCLADLQPAHQRHVIQAYYGVNQPAQTLRAMARAFGMSEDATAALMQIAVRKLWTLTLKTATA